MRALAERFLDLVYPPSCIFCGKLTGEDWVCASCRDRLPRVEGPVCAVCGRPRGQCSCLRNAYSFERCCSVFLYESPVREAIGRVKNHNDRPAARYFAGEMAELFRREYAGEHFDSITAVPMRPSRRRSRGYNQAERLASLLGEQLELPCRFGLLAQREKAEVQHLLSARERKENAWASFRGLGEDLSGQRFLLVDDIMTTGATLDCCAHLLREQGAEAVFCLTAATTLYQEEEGTVLEKNRETPYNK